MWHQRAFVNLTLLIDQLGYLHRTYNVSIKMFFNNNEVREPLLNGDPTLNMETKSHTHKMIKQNIRYFLKQSCRTQYRCSLVDCIFPLDILMNTERSMRFKPHGVKTINNNKPFIRNILTHRLNSTLFTKPY